MSSYHWSSAQTFAQTVKKVCRKELRYRECLEGMDLSLGERQRLCANTYSPHPRTVKVPSLPIFSPGADKPSALISLVDIFIVTSSSSRDISEENGGALSAPISFAGFTWINNGSTT